tara:strand:+ start:2906 stop:3064 length:159 start_codon:yes stop_codon:yes gene_type:complete
MEQFNKTWLVWLALVSIWNFGWPTVHPIADIIVAAGLSISVYHYTKRSKNDL